MTFEEAKKVAAICSEADSGCSNCVKALLEELQKQFPEFTWIYEDSVIRIVT